MPLMGVWVILGLFEFFKKFLLVGGYLKISLGERISKGFFLFKISSGHTNLSNLNFLLLNLDLTIFYWTELGLLCSLKLFDQPHFINFINWMHNLSLFKNTFKVFKEIENMWKPCHANATIRLKHVVGTETNMLKLTVAILEVLREEM